jgi:hypothetical protein
MIQYDRVDRCTTPSSIVLCITCTPTGRNKNSIHLMSRIRHARMTVESSSRQMIALPSSPSKQSGQDDRPAEQQKPCPADSTVARSQNNIISAMRSVWVASGA